MVRNIRLLYIHNFLVDFRFQDAFRPIYFAQITGSYTLAMAVSIIVALFFEEPRVHMAAPQKSLRHLKDACIKIYGNTHLLLLVIAQALSRADEAKFQFQTIFINTL